MLTNYHTHCEFCDGKATAAVMAQTARDQGFSILGFSSHAPLPFDTSWNLRLARLPEYVDAIRALGRKHSLMSEHAPAMHVLVGLEIDYIEGLCGPSDGRFADAGLDYTIGSTHYVTPGAINGPASLEPGPTGNPAFGFTVDESEARFSRDLAHFYDDDIYRLVDDYFVAVAASVKAGGFDILGHMDLIRKNNRGESRFSERSERYRAAAMMVVDALAGTDIIVEINTGGMARGKTDSPYPSLWVLKELRARSVAICVNADAHAPEHLMAHRDAGLSLAANAGYDRLTAIGPNGRFTMPLDR
jgi:histidinol-phosphatase (PHP family)